MIKRSYTQGARAFYEWCFRIGYMIAKSMAVAFSWLWVIGHKVTGNM